MHVSLAKNIREIRRSRKLSQEYVAEQLGVSRQAVSKWESGQSQPNANNLVELAKLLDVPLTRLTDCGTDEMEAGRQGKLRLPKNYDVMVVGAYSGSVMLTTVKTNDRFFFLYAAFWVFLFALLMAVNITRLPTAVRAKTAGKELLYCILIYCIATFLTPIIGNVFSSVIILVCCVLYVKHIRFPHRT